MWPRPHGWACLAVGDGCSCGRPAAWLWPRCGPCRAGSSAPAAGASPLPGSRSRPRPAAGVPGSGLAYGLPCTSRPAATRGRVALPAGTGVAGAQAAAVRQPGPPALRPAAAAMGNLPRAVPAGWGLPAHQPRPPAWRRCAGGQPGVPRLSPPYGWPPGWPGCRAGRRAWAVYAGYQPGGRRGWPRLWPGLCHRPAIASGPARSPAAWGGPGLAAPTAVVLR